MQTEEIAARLLEALQSTEDGEEGLAMAQLALEAEGVSREEQAIALHDWTEQQIEEEQRKQ